MAKPLITINGDIKLQSLFNDLNVTPGEIRQVSRSVASIVRTQARKSLPVKSGNLKRGIVIKNSRNKKYANVWVGPNYGRFGKNRAPHAHLVAFSFMRSTGKISTRKPLGQFIQEAAGIVGDKALKSAERKYIKIIERKIAKKLR